MSILVVPTGSDPFYTQATTLEGATYLLTFAFSQREACWYLSIATEEGDDIYNGMKLVCNWPLTKKCADPRLFPGELLCLSNSTDLTPPGLTELGPGLRCELTYYTSDELP